MHLSSRKWLAPVLLTTALGLFTVSEFSTAQVTQSARWNNEFGRKYDAKLDIVYQKIDSVENKLDIYLPKDTSKIVPAVIWFHGGGWRRGTKDSISGQLAFYFEKGWAVVNVDYRMTPTALAPAAVIDCRCALLWVVRNAGKMRIDKDKIILSGSSAGGHLALITGMLPSGSLFDKPCGGDLNYSIAAIINWYGITDVNDLLSGVNRKGYAVKWLGDQPDRENIAKQVSPLTYVRNGLPPVFSVHGDADTTVPYSHAVRLHESLTALGVPNYHMTIKGGMHGKFKKEENESIYRAIDGFFEKYSISSGK